VNYLLKISCFILLVILLMSCSKEKKQAELSQYVENLSKKTVASIEAIPIFKSYESSRYDPNEGHSPFSPLKATVSEGNQKLTHVLQRYPLKALTMVGTLSDHDMIWALIRTPKGRVYPIRYGQVIGKLSGYVKAIDENHVEVEESVFDKKRNTQVQREKILMMNNIDSTKGKMR